MAGAAPAATSPLEQAVVQLQNELGTTRQQLLVMAQSRDALQAAHNLLKSETERMLKEREDEIKKSEAKLAQFLFTQKFDLVELKTLQPEVFKGRRAENFLPWAKKVKTFCNAKKQGFRRALETTGLLPVESESALTWMHSHIEYTTQCMDPANKRSKARVKACQELTEEVTEQMRKKEDPESSRK